jgi:hypothetical protein
MPEAEHVRSKAAVKESNAFIVLRERAPERLSSTLVSLSGAMDLILMRRN